MDPDQTPTADQGDGSQDAGDARAVPTGARAADRDPAAGPAPDVTGADEGAGDWVVTPGTDVVDSQGSHVGRVDDIRDGHLVVRKGRFFASDYFIPFSAIASHDDATIHLGVVADERATRIWHQRPAAGTAAAGAPSDAPAAMDTEARLEWLTDRDGNVRVPVLREELSATRRPVVRGAVRIETRVTEHEETLEVPVTEERVRIQRRRFDRDAAGGDITVDGGTFEIPFYGEDVDVERRVRVIEEIVITREAVETVRRVHGTVRTEEVTVDEGGVPDENRVSGALSDAPVPLPATTPDRATDI